MKGLSPAQIMYCVVPVTLAALLALYKGYGVHIRIPGLFNISLIPMIHRGKCFVVIVFNCDHTIYFCVQHSQTEQNKKRSVYYDVYDIFLVFYIFYLFVSTA